MENQKPSKVKILIIFLLISVVGFIIVLFFSRSGGNSEKAIVNSESQSESETEGESITQFFESPPLNRNQSEEEVPNLADYVPKTTCELEGQTITIGTVVSDATCGE